MRAARVNGVFVGFITFQKEKESYFDTKITDYVEVIELFVQEANRGRGIGRRLMQAAEQYAAEVGLSHIKVSSSSANDAALSAYKAMGYTTSQIMMAKEVI